MFEFDKLPVWARHHAWDLAAASYANSPGEVNKDKAIKDAKEIAKPLLKAACRSRGVNSIMAMLIIAVVARLIVALIIYLINKYKDPRVTLTEMLAGGYPSDAPGYTAEMN